MDRSEQMRRERRRIERKKPRIIAEHVSGEAVQRTGRSFDRRGGIDERRWDRDIEILRPVTRGPARIVGRRLRKIGVERGSTSASERERDEDGRGAKACVPPPNAHALQTLAHTRLFRE